MQPAFFVLRIKYTSQFPICQPLFYFLNPVYLADALSILLPVRRQP